MPQNPRPSGSSAARSFDAAHADPWIDRYLQSSVRIYGATMQGGTGGTPKLVFGPHWLNPQPANAGELISILQTSLGVPQPWTRSGPRSSGSKILGRR